MCDGLARQEIAEGPSVAIHAPVDLTGVLSVLATLPSTPSAEDVTLVHAAMRQLDLGLPVSSFDVALSAGVLTQMFQSLVDSSLSEAAVVEAVLRLRDAHLRAIVGLLRPGGTGVIVTDVVSTSTAPTLLGSDAADLEPAMAIAVSDHNFFTGTNPYRLAAVLEEEEWYAERVEDVQLDDPWLWAVTPDRQHLTCAVTFRRR